MGQEQSLPFTTSNNSYLRASDKQKLVTPHIFNADHVELMTHSRSTPNMLPSSIGASASMMLMGNIGNASIDTNSFRLTCRQLLDIIKPSSGGILEGFTTTVKNIEEIMKLYDQIITNYSKQTTQLQYTMNGKNNNNLLLGASSSSSSMTNSENRHAFDMMTDAISTHILQTKNQLEELVELNEQNARRSLKRNSVSSASAMFASTNNLQAAGYDWSNLDNKQRYFEIKDEIEILTSHHLEEIEAFKQLASVIHNAELQGLDYSHPSTQAQLDITHVLDEFGAEYWKTNFGGNVFSVDKECFLDVLDTYFQDLRNRKTWVEEINDIIDPTCDSIVSIIDFRTVLKWFGPFSSFFFNPIDAFLQMKHFWGSLTSIEAQELLDKCEPGTFIVRFCETEPGSFYASVVEDNGDNFGYFDSLLTSDNKQTFHYLVRRKKDEREGKMYFVLIDSDVEHKHENIDSLFKQYHLTFRIPYLDDTKKEEIAKKKKGQEELDFVAFMKTQKTKMHIQDDDDDDDDGGFTTFKGRLPSKKKQQTSSAASKINLLTSPSISITSKITSNSAGTATNNSDNKLSKMDVLPNITVSNSSGTTALTSATTISQKIDESTTTTTTNTMTMLSATTDSQNVLDTKKSLSKLLVNVAKDHEEDSAASLVTVSPTTQSTSSVDPLLQDKDTTSSDQ
ncbi:hypothetical protein FDP41_004781 [Naegleria fowleri]|uniref:Uncharacterized protein n=1 Tax=Naegleria fowleri TaxID=5763 RepID=A0A6A5BMF1_NAEFO|nr:uncharacterized protein FDP41_004781 [Naegleria fowleri]KAF0976106.1 hypothetical protein FDP41_004781 [Naegleria fowleri]